MLPPLQDLYRIAPEIVLCAFGMLVMFLAPIIPKTRHGVLSAISLLGAALALAATQFLALYPGPAYSGLLRSDAFSLFVHLIVCGVAFLAILGSANYLKREDLYAGEFCALILLATAGMGVMASAQELLTAFIGLEMSSIASYVLVSYKRNAPRSNEAAMKYFLLGSFATAFFLYGIALTYGATGTTHLDLVGQAGAQTSTTLLKMGLGFVFVGLAFKVAAAPFQLWTPDVYEGAPAPVTAMLSTGPKAAAFALALRILANIEAASALWFWALWVAAVLSMFAGNLGALVQTNIKRMLAYSSIAHAGYIVVALHRVVDRSGRYGVRRTAPHARHRFRSQSRSQYALIPNSHEGFAISRMCVWRRTSCAVLWRRRLAGVVMLCSQLKKPPAGRRRHENLRSVTESRESLSFAPKKGGPGACAPGPSKKLSLFLRPSRK